MSVGHWSLASAGGQGLELQTPLDADAPRLRLRLSAGSGLARTQAPRGGPWSGAQWRETGLSKSSVQRLWSAHKLQPRRVRDFQLSKDLQFQEKFWDVVGLYLDPPEQAVVLCSDESASVRLSNAPSPDSLWARDTFAPWPHDYYRHER